MKYCTKCGNALAEGARFCNACGAQVQTFNAVSQVYANPYAKAEAPKTAENLIAEEQKLLNQFSLGLKHERLAFKISGIVWIIISSFIILASFYIGLFVGAATAAPGNDSEAALIIVFMYFLYGILFLPIGIVNLIMMKKVGVYRAKLFTDCRDGFSHFRIGSIVFCAIFNPVALVFNIVYFIMAKNNAAVIERIKARQQ